MNRTIYVSDKIDKVVVEIMERDGISYSKAILSGFEIKGVSQTDKVLAELRLHMPVERDMLDRIESKLDQIICGFGDYPVVGNVKIDPAFYEHKEMDGGMKITSRLPTQAEKDEVIPLKSDDTKISESDLDLLKKTQANGQAKFDAERKKRSVKKEKIEKVKGLMGHSGPMPKGTK